MIERADGAYVYFFSITTEAVPLNFPRHAGPRGKRSDFIADSNAVEAGLSYRGDNQMDGVVRICGRIVGSSVETSLKCMYESTGILPTIIKYWKKHAIGCSARRLSKCSAPHGWTAENPSFELAASERHRNAGTWEDSRDYDGCVYIRFT